MIAKQRFLTALKCGIPDRVPLFEHLFSPHLQKEVLGYKSELYDGESIVKLAHKLGIDSSWIPVNGFCGTEEEVHDEGVEYTDEWGVTYKKNGWPIMAQIDTPIKGRNDWNNYKLPDANASFRLDRIKQAVKANEGETAIVCGLLGPFTMMSWYFMDLPDFSMAMFTDPGLIHEINSAYTDWALELGKRAAKTEGTDAFLISDDWGSSTGPLIAPEQFNEFFLPPFRKMVQGLKALGFPVIMHNDGQIWDMLDSLADTGISGYNPVERGAGMDLKTVKERYQEKLCCIGNVDNKVTLVQGNVEDVIAETKECLEIGMPGGGYILSSDHSFHDDIPLENIFALIETAKKYGEYK
ncbi:MAG: uroporphyrinogen decarboxylase family protein [Bacteroidota bacterium]